MGWLRLQSTLLDQKHYDMFLLSVPADMLMKLALREDITVLDASRHDRGSRACWQGLAFLKFVCGRLWGFQVPVNPKWGKDFEERWKKLDKRTKKWIGYYKVVWNRGCANPGVDGFRLRWECLKIERERELKELI